MTRFFVWMGLVAALVGFFAPTFAERAAPSAQDVACKKCKHAGVLPCGEHKKAECALERDVLYCSVVAGCETCAGTGHVDCAACTNEEAEKRLAKKRKEAPGLAKELEVFHETMGRSVRVAVSDHFVLVMEVEGMKADKKRRNGHELMHLYVERLERLFDDYTETLGAKDSEFEKRVRVLIWSDLEDQKKASKQFCTNESEKGAKLLGADPTYSVAFHKRDFKTDEELHRNVVHHTAHLILSHQKPSMWLGNIRGGWADAGVAHWFEDRYFGVCDNYCYQDVTPSEVFGAKRNRSWKPPLRKLASSGSVPPLLDLFQRDTATLTPTQHAVAFSIVDHLIAEDAAKFNRLLFRLRSRTPTGDALKEIFGLKIEELETRWKAWVVETYPSR